MCWLVGKHIPLTATQNVLDGFLLYSIKDLAIDMKVALPTIYEFMKPFHTFQDFLVIEDELNLSCHSKQENSFYMCELFSHT